MVRNSGGGLDITIKPIVWKEKERFNGEVVDCLTIILRTRGCYWDSCLMCGYTKDSYQATEDELIQQIDYAITTTPVVKIFTSGSFFDSREISDRVKKYLKDKITGLGIEKLIVESRPEFVTEENLAEFEGINLEVGIGLETADDFIRDVCINKGFKFKDFERAVKTLKKFNFRVKAYLLLKPPFLSESEAIEDVLNSMRKVENLVDVISINLTNVQRNTFVEKLWRSKLYRPPWLWSAVYVLTKAKIDTICDPVAAGKMRGPHNCGKCDESVARAIKEFSLTQDGSVFDELSCECIHAWKRVLDLEDYARIPLFW
jgi:hypothetical protein